MTKGALTHQRLVRHGLESASLHGFSRVSVADLAERTQLSKSGVFVHFGSSESLQLELLDAAAELAGRAIVEPALEVPAGLARLRRLFELWLGWAPRSGLPGGCPFVAAAVEFDDTEGPVRDRLVATLDGLIAVFVRAIEDAVGAGDIDARVRPKELAWQLFGLYAAHHTLQRLMRDPEADAIALRGFDELVVRP